MYRYNFARVDSIATFNYADPDQRSRSNKKGSDSVCQTNNMHHSLAIATTGFLNYEHNIAM